VEGSEYFLYRIHIEYLINKKAIRAIFDNKKNYRGKKRGNGIEKHSAPPRTAFHDPIKCYESIKAGSRMWAHFTSEVDGGRDLFRVECYDRIVQEATKTQAKSPSGAFSKAFAKLWAKEDQTMWNVKARQHNDVDQ
jgi:hypothetical protein